MAPLPVDVAAFVEPPPPYPAIGGPSPPYSSGPPPPYSSPASASTAPRWFADRPSAVGVTSIDASLTTTTMTSTSYDTTTTTSSPACSAAVEPSVSRPPPLLPLDAPAGVPVTPIFGSFASVPEYAPVGQGYWLQPGTYRFQGPVWVVPYAN